jgi:ApbE superfamily uncharacterized protein (UPF0280 family)
MPGYRKQNDIDRDYRSLSAPDLQKFRILAGESDLWILSSHEVRDEIRRLLRLYRRQLKEFIYQNPVFQTTLMPYPVGPEAPELIRRMSEAGAKVKVGPMASVAGAIAGLIGENIRPEIPDLIIENGGDIYLRSTEERRIAVFAGNSPFSMKIALKIPPEPDGLGICTSAGTVGPSLSLGKADATVIISPDVALADAAATAVGNMIIKTSDVWPAVDFAKSIPGVTGVLLIKDDKMAAWGELTLIPL